jgi:lipopolysaccharide transport system permease protein
VYCAPLDDARGWSYAAGDPFVVADVQVSDGAPRRATAREATLGQLRRESAFRALPGLFTGPVAAIYSNWRLIRSLVRRDIQARYRGSFGDVLWTVLNPLLLMATYFFVFGVVLRARFGGDPSPFGFVLYFLAGMMPWLAISEAVGRAPGIVVDNRNFVKKLLFPLETLPVNVVASGLVNQLIALIIFLAMIFIARGAVPVTAAWLPVLLIPQIALALGISWFLGGLGVYVRDLGQVIGFVLTLWFFLTPICYPDTQLPAWTLPILGKNPLYTLVRGYRRVLLEGHAPEFQAMWKLWLLAGMALVVGYGAFTRMRRSFADVI